MNQGILFPKLLWPPLRTKCSSYREKLLLFRPRLYKNFAITRTIHSNSKRADQFLKQNISLTCSWGVLRNLHEKNKVYYSPLLSILLKTAILIQCCKVIFCKTVRIKVRHLSISRWTFFNSMEKKKVVKNLFQVTTAHMSMAISFKGMDIK